MRDERGTDPNDPAKARKCYQHVLKHFPWGQFQTDAQAGVQRILERLGKATPPRAAPPQEQEEVDEPVESTDTDMDTDTEAPSEAPTAEPTPPK
jgi:hypothetical protein